MMVFFSLSNASSVSVSATSPLTSISPKADKQSAFMSKILSSKAGKFIMKKLEKRHKRLSIKLAAAEKAGDVKKAERIKQKMSAKGSLTRVGIELMVGGFLTFITGFVMAGGFGAGAILLWLGWLAFLIGLIILIIGLVQG